MEKQTVRYLAFDTETGGLTIDCSLLTAYFVVLDENLEVIDELDLKIKPNKKGPYVVTGEAMDINGIDLSTHDREAIEYSEAGQMLRTFLWTHSLKGALKMVPVGQNVTYDIQMVNAWLLGKKEWENYVSYRVLDTGVVGKFLQLQGNLPTDLSGGLSSFAKYFDLTFEGGQHNAKADTLVTVQVLREFMQMGPHNAL